MNITVKSLLNQKSELDLSSW